MFIGSKIKELRKIKKLSQEQMAARLAISTTAYRKIESDNTDINFSRLQQIADIFDISVTLLVSFGEKVSYPTPTGHTANIISIELINEVEKLEQRLQAQEAQIKLLQELLEDKIKIIELLTSIKNN